MVAGSLLNKKGGYAKAVPRPRGNHQEDADLDAALSSSLAEHHLKAPRRYNAAAQRQAQIARWEARDRRDVSNMSDEEIMAMIMAQSETDASKETQQNYDIDARPGHIGIANLGKTCYLGSIMQVLGHSGRLVTFLNDVASRFYEFENLNPITIEVLNIIRKMYIVENGGESLDISPLLGSLAESFGSERYAPLIYGEHMLALADITGSIDSATNGALTALTRIPIVRERLCTSCATDMDGQAAPESVLTLPIPQDQPANVVRDLRDCFAKFSEPRNANIVECPHCHGRSVTARTVDRLVGEGPQVLMIDLGRFTDSGQFVRVKLNYPMEFDLSSMPGAAKAIGKYRFMGALHHKGTDGGGHMVSETYVLVDGEYQHANDRDVYQIDEPEQESQTVTFLIYDRYE